MEALGRLRDVIAARGGRAEPIALDVESPESCAAFAAEARERLGLPSILVNNAGIGVFRPVDEFLPDEFERQFRVNVFGLYHMTRLALPLMKQAGEGDIVNVSSLAGESSAPRGSAYFATKHAVNGFTKCVMEEAREHGIRVMLLCPGSIDTRFHVDSHPGSHAKDQSWMLEARDVAAALVHAASAPRGALLSRIDARPARPARKK
jgi:NAD(P)-dependent dehydrogenase (short-subunit alcohol dehydrogenase family)